MSRPDQSITFLKDAGYCVLRMPRSDARPLQTLLRASRKDLVRLGELATISTPGDAPLPPVSLDNVAPVQIEGKESSATKVEVGINILGHIIGALGGSTLGISVGYRNARSMTFKFENVLEDHVELDRLDRYLTTCSFMNAGTTVADALIDDALFVITSTLKTNRFTVNATGEAGRTIGLDVPVISGIASGTLSVDTSKATEGTVTYEGTTPVIFGFQAVQVFTDEVDGRPIFSAMNPVKAGAVAARAAGTFDTNAASRLTLDEGVFFRMTDASPVTENVRRMTAP